MRVIATTEVDRARILPTLRSMPAVRITYVIASAMMPITRICRRISVRLPGCRKMRDPSAGGRAEHDGQDHDAGQSGDALKLSNHGTISQRASVAADAMIFSCVASRGVEYRRNRPSLITMMRSQQRSSSGSSELTKITPFPSAASFR